MREGVLLVLQQLEVARRPSVCRLQDATCGYLGHPKRGRLQVKLRKLLPLSVQRTEIPKMQTTRMNILSHDQVMSVQGGRAN